MDVRDLTSLAECRAVVDVQTAVWGRDSETVPASLLLASIKRGGILIGAFDGETLVGFVWSMPGWRDGRPTQWSHMTGLVPEARRRGLGERLKWAQRDRALQAGIELIEWTFDPLQAANAHFNLTCLGAVATEYRVNAYGEMSGPLHRGTPTDRLIAEWWIARPHVERRRAAREPKTDTGSRFSDGDVLKIDSRYRISVRTAEVQDAAEAIETREAGGWLVCRGVRADAVARRVLVAVPPRFTDMQQSERPLALQWRLGVREAFSAYFSRGYRAVDFFLDRQAEGGAYLLAREE